MASKHTADVLSAMIDGKKSTDSSSSMKAAPKKGGTDASKQRTSETSANRFEDTRYSTKDSDYGEKPVDDEDEEERAALADQLHSAVRKGNPQDLWEAVSGVVEHHARKKTRMTLD